MKKDIEHRTDIEQLVNTFYDKVKKDDVIGDFFNLITVIDWDKHLPVMYDFWENIIFHTGGYTGNPMKHHEALHRKAPLTAVHFNRWISLFNATIDELFQGQKAEQAKQRALSIATVMRINIIGLPTGEEPIY